MAGATVLLIASDPQDLKRACVLLTQSGYDVRTAEDAEQAQAVLGTFVPELILLDLQPTTGDELLLARKLKADPRTRNIVIVALTSHSLMSDADRAREAGCDGYVERPELKALPALIAECLEERRARLLN